MRGLIPFWLPLHHKIPIKTLTEDSKKGHELITSPIENKEIGRCEGYQHFLTASFFISGLDIK